LGPHSKQSDNRPPKEGWVGGVKKEKGRKKFVKGIRKKASRSLEQEKKVQACIENGDRNLAQKRESIRGERKSLGKRNSGGSSQIAKGRVPEAIPLDSANLGGLMTRGHRKIKEKKVCWLGPTVQLRGGETRTIAGRERGEGHYRFDGRKKLGEADFRGLCGKFTSRT